MVEILERLVERVDLAAVEVLVVCDERSLLCGMEFGALAKCGRSPTSFLMIGDTVWTAYRIAGFEIEPASSSIRGPETSATLPPKALEVLACLARNPGEVVAKDRLLDLVWGEGAGGEDVLANAIWQLRQAFGDDARQPRLIGTVFRRGYRLLVDASCVDPMNEPARTVAIVPFSSGGRHPDGHYFSSTLTESLHHLLTQKGELRVLRVAAQQLRARPEDPLDQIGWMLGAGHLIEGSVHVTGSAVSIKLRHYHWSSGTVVWAETFTAPRGRLQELEHRAADALLGQLGSRRNGTEARVAVATELLDPPTYARFLRGRHRVNQSDFDEIAAGISELEAVAREVPDAAQVHEVMARGFFILAAWGYGPGRELLPRVVAHAELALESDLLSPDARIWGILASRLQGWHLTAAVDELARAVADRPYHWTGRDAYARCLAALGRFEEAVAHSRLALASHPLFLLSKPPSGCC